MNGPFIKFHLPRYDEIPDVGLYLEQTVKYINHCLEPIHLSITASMLSNYVKKGFVQRPVKKQYYADQIAYLIFISIVKQTLSLQNINYLIELQKKTYTSRDAYNYFCIELEKGIQELFTDKPQRKISEKMSFEKKTLRSVVIAMSHIIYLNFCFYDIQESCK